MAYLSERNTPDKLISIVLFHFRKKARVLVHRQLHLTFAYIISSLPYLVTVSFIMF